MKKKVFTAVDVRDNGGGHIADLGIFNEEERRDLFLFIFQAAW